jgi:hypothetical protein
MTWVEKDDHTNSFWEDGEWIRWDSLIEHPDAQEPDAEVLSVDPKLMDVFERFVEVATLYKNLTGNYLQVWGELGELFAALAFEIRMHRPMTRGSDGTIGNDFIEVKTISPEKSNDSVQVKRTGNFNKLAVVKISKNFKFEARLVDRRSLRAIGQKHATIAWNQMPGPSVETDV